MTRQQYVEINGTNRYLNDEGDLTNGVGNVLIRGWAIATLGLKVETEGPRFEDIEPGIYSPHGNLHNVIVKKDLTGDWINGEGCPLDTDKVKLLPKWHEEGILYRLNKGEATNA